MENTFKKAFIAMFFLMGCLVVGQEENDVDLTHIYNKWVFSSDESSNSIRVYRNEEFFGDTEEGQEKTQRWRFAEHSAVFFNTPFNGNIAKKSRGIRCPTGVRQNAYLPTRTKGKWELAEENGVTSLLLHYYRAEKGKPFVLARTVRYLVVHLEEDLMELIMINGTNAL